MITRWLYYTCSSATTLNRIAHKRSIVLHRNSNTLNSIPGLPSSSSRCFATSDNNGEMIYQKALEMMESVKKQDEEREKERSEKMYKAWQKSLEAERNPKSQGVAVVKTLAKEARKDVKSSDNKRMQEAINLLETAANDHQHPMALVQIGNFRLEEASKKDADAKEKAMEAMDLFRRAGEGGSRVGWYNLGNLLWTGYPAGSEDEYNGDEIMSNSAVEEKIINPDLHEAMEAFMNAIDLGDSDAMYLVGVHRMTSGGRENIHSGLNLVQKAADAGHGGAKYYLALLNLNGEPNIGLEPCSLDEFVLLLDQAVEAGNVDGLFTRGHSQFHGTEGYSQDYQKAMEDFITAAENDHADAAVSAGAMFHGGIGVPKDQRRAFEFYQMAGELGSKEGWQNVVACYTTGEGVTKSLETAKYISETMLKEDPE